MPPVFFARSFGKRPYPGIDHCARQNVVLHAKMQLNPYTTSLRERLVQRRMPPRYPDHYSSASPDSQFRHCRYNLGPYGKVLAFRSAANLIRAGKFTHADALLSCLLFLRWSKNPTWPARVSAPNMVVSGKLTKKPSDALRSHPLATHTPKFPGVAVKLPSGTTTEVYDSGAFIIPGITSAAQLHVALSELADIV